MTKWEKKYPSYTDLFYANEMKSTRHKQMQVGNEYFIINKHNN